MTTAPKDIAKLSTEEAMAIAKLPVKPIPKKLSPAKQFIISDGLEEGADHVPASIIYTRYTKWATAANVDSLTAGKFFKEFKLYFKKILRQGVAHYVLSAKGFNFSLEEIYQSDKVLATEKRNSRGNKKSKKEPV